MKIPEESAKNVLRDFISKSLLNKAAAAEVVENLEKEKDVNWNLVLSKQFESEQGGSDEPES